MVVDLVLYSLLSVLPIIGLLLSESCIKEHPKILAVLTTIAFLSLFIVDITLPIVHKNLDNFRPSYSSHLILACFVFFNFSKLWYALISSLLVTFAHLMILAFMTYKESTMLIKLVSILLVVLFNLTFLIRFSVSS